MNFKEEIFSSLVYRMTFARVYIFISEGGEGWKAEGWEAGRRWVKRAGGYRETGNI